MTTHVARVGVLVTLALALTGAGGAEAQTNITPTATVVVTPADDWATRSFQDPIDMNQKTDLNWFIFDSTTTWTNHDFIDDPNTQHPGNRLFSGTATGPAANPDGDAFMYILETGNPVSARLGRTGDNYSINTATYRTVALRMGLPGTQGVPRPSSFFQFLWYTKSIFDADTVLSVSNGASNYGGWGIYIVDLPTFGVSSGPNWLSTGTVRTLRFDPTTTLGDTVQLDWIRLAPQTSEQTITWAGGGSYDIYLDTGGTTCDGDLGPIFKAISAGTVASTNRSSGTFSFQASALPPGDYRVALRSPGTGLFTCSSGFFRVNGIPELAFTSPSEEGSSDDFATVQLNNAWDMNATTDVDVIGCVNSPAITTLASAERPDGTSLGGVSAFSGTSLSSGPPAGSSCSGAGDPALFYLWPGGFGRGATYRIDTSRYRILTLDVGLPGARSLDPTTGGSVARVYWSDLDTSNPGSSLINGSQDILINHRSGANVFDKITLDMATLDREIDNGQSGPNWVGSPNYFRVDPHEFNVVTDFWVRQAKLAAFERLINQQYTIRWTYNDPFHAPSPPTLTVRYDTDTNAANGFAGVACGPVNPSAVTSCLWQMPVSAADGSYYLYAEYSDGLNTNANYAKWPVVYEPFVVQPRIVLNRSRLNFGGTNSGNTKTSAQDVRLSVVGSGTVSWTASVEPVGGGPTWVNVSPASGTGSGTLTISIKDIGIDNNLVGDWVVKVSSTDATNSPQYIRVYLKMYQPASLTRPAGTLDVPTGATTVSGSIVVGGWAVDDIEISQIQVFRDPVAGEPLQGVFPAGHPGRDKIYIATAEIVRTRPFGADTALFVDDARSDIEALFPATPWNYRTGWGYLMLTRGLPNSGTGTYTLYAYAFDRDGTYPTGYTLLGSKTFSGDNSPSAAPKPFGAIDAPFPGETVSGTKLTGGWALTQPVTCRVTNLVVSIDSLPLQPVIYGDTIAGFETYFPKSQFDNSPDAGAAFFLDSTTLSNGVHQIGYLVTDDCGKQDGIGSRFFSVFNAGSPVMTENQVADAPAAQEQAAQEQAAQEQLAPEPQADGLSTVSEPTEQVARELVPPAETSPPQPTLAEMLRAETFPPQPNRADRTRAGSVRAGTQAAPVGRLADARTVFPHLGLNVAVVTAPDPGTAVRVVHGYAETGAWEGQVEIGPDGYREVRLDVSERIEAHLADDTATPPGDAPDGSPFTAYQVVNGELRALPTGSSFDTRQGIFYWQPGPGYFGTYDFVFVWSHGTQVRNLRLAVGTR